MKVQVIYSSLTGCTEKVAKAIYDGLETQENSIHNIKDGAPKLDGDIILVGYWCMGPGPNKEFQDFLRTIKGKAVGIFCTLGFYSDSAYAQSTLVTAQNILKENNEIIGCCACMGKTADSLKNYTNEDKTPALQKEVRWEITDAHPTKAECALASERFNERIYIYKRCKELGIEFTPIL